MRDNNIGTEFHGFSSWATEAQTAGVVGKTVGQEGRLTSAGGQCVTPLTAGQALGPSSPLSYVSWVANELDHVVEVELAALSQAVDWIAWVSTSDRCKKKGREVSPPAIPHAHIRPSPLGWRLTHISLQGSRVWLDHRGGGTGRGFFAGSIM